MLLRTHPALALAALAALDLAVLPAVALARALGPEGLGLCGIAS